MPEAFGAAEWSLMVATALLWGTSYLFIAIGIESLPPPLVTLVRIALASVTLAFFPSARRAHVAPEDRLRIVLLAVLWMALPLTLFPIAQQWISSAAAGMITGAQPIVAAVVATALLHRRPGTRQIQGLAIGFLGVVLIAVPVASSGTTAAIGVALVVVAVVSYAVATNLAVPLQQRYGALPVIWRATLVATVLVAPWGLVSVPGTSPTAPSLAALVPLGVLSTGIGYVTFTTLIGRAGAVRGAVAIYLLPLVAIVAGVVVQDETIAPLSLLGAGIVIAGAWLTSRAEH